MNDTMMAPLKSKKQPCGCGCGGGEECCELDCLVEPRFYCGQLLTDQDLTALLEWVKGKTALARYRHGWGVICGLGVHCDPAAGHEGMVTVTPGYAVDCCGNDVIVCKETPVDLSMCCKPQANPCNDWTPPKPKPGDDRMVRFGAFEVLQSQVQAVDLFMRYAETQSDPKTALARGGCGGTTACEYTRTHETAELYCRTADDCTDTSEQGAIAWLDAYKKGLTHLLATMGKFGDGDDARRNIQRLCAWLQDNPLHSFCFIREWLCDLQRADDIPATWLKDAAFWIVQDWRNHFLRCDCFGCGPDTGIPLARIWLWRRPEAGGRERCVVLYINPYPPFRRPISPECWPTRANSVNLAPFIWQVRDTAYPQLRNLGFQQLTFEQFTFADVKRLDELLSGEALTVSSLDLTETGRLTVFWIEDYCGEPRIVHFSTGPQGKRAAEDPGKLADDDPRLELQAVTGIGPGIAKRLKAKGLGNVRAVVAADPKVVQEAVADRPANADLARNIIQAAKDHLDRIQKGE